VREAKLDDVRNQIAEVKGTFNEIRNFDLKGEITKHVDGDGTLGRTFSEKPLNTTPSTPAWTPPPTARDTEDAPAMIPPQTMAPYKPPAAESIPDGRRRAGRAFLRAARHARAAGARHPAPAVAEVQPEPVLPPALATPRPAEVLRRVQHRRPGRRSDQRQADAVDRPPDGAAHAAALVGRRLRHRFAVCYYFSTQIYGFLARPLATILFEQGGGDRRMIFTALYEAFFTYLKVAFFGAVFFSFPIWATQLWLFVAPGCTAREAGGAALHHRLALLFLLGAALAYYFIFPLAWHFFISFETPAGAGSVPIQLEAKVSEYLSLVMHMILAFGIAFQMPVLLTLLCKVGILNVDSLRKGRRYAIVGMFVLAAIITPPDVISQIGLAVPLILLYEISILAASWMAPKPDPLVP
jgi:sec-independent protein translocase protein TatC